MKREESKRNPGPSLQEVMLALTIEAIHPADVSAYIEELRILGKGE